MEAYGGWGAFFVDGGSGRAALPPALTPWTLLSQMIFTVTRVTAIAFPRAPVEIVQHLPIPLNLIGLFGIIARFP